MKKKMIKINRAPVLTLWATVVAVRLGYDQNEALTFGKAVAGLNAQSKGRSLGIYAAKKDDTESKEKKQAGPANLEFVALLGRGVPAVRTPKGLRAAIKGDEIDPQSVQKYLEGKFGDNLDEAREAMEQLAKAFSPKRLETEAFSLYEKFRPKIPEGTKGWGAKGDLELDRIRSLAE